MLDQHLRLEVQPGIQPKIFMGWSRVAIAAPVGTAPIRIHAEPERNVRAVILSHNASGRIRQIFGFGPIRFGQKINVPVKMLPIGIDVDGLKPIRRINVRSCAPSGHAPYHPWGTPRGHSWTPENVRYPQLDRNLQAEIKRIARFSG